MGISFRVEGARSCCVGPVGGFAELGGEVQRCRLSSEPQVSQTRRRDADLAPTVNGGRGRLQQLSHSGSPAQPVDDLVSFGAHEADYAIFGSLSQAQTCDIRHCDDRKRVRYGAMDQYASLRPEAAAVFRRLDALGLTQRQLADALKVEENKISKVKKGTRQFQGPELLAAYDWLDQREREHGSLEKAPDILPARSADGGEAVEIIQLDLSLPMGPGATVDDYIEEEPRLFDLAYIRSFTRTPPHRLRLARGVGDSMFPTLLSNDLVWIDSTQTVLNQSDRIWAVSINGGAAIKRLRPLKGGRVLVLSDNSGPGHDPYEVDADEIMIGGRVIRFARDL